VDTRSQSQLDTTQDLTYYNIKANVFVYGKIHIVKKYACNK